MRGVDTTKLENEQAQTTKGLEETTKAVKGVKSTIADGDRSVSAKLTMIGRVLSIESPAEKEARKQAQEQASAAAANFQRLIQLQAQGNATDEEVLAAQEQMKQTAEEAAEAAEKRSMFDRFGSDEAPPTPTPGSDDGGGDASGGGGFMKTFGKFFKMIKGFVGILLAVAIPALALILNSPVFEKLKEGLFNLVDFFFEKVMPVLKQIKDELMPIFKKLYDNVIKPIQDFFVDFMTKEGGGFDVLFTGIKKQFKNFKAIFDDVVNLLSALMKGDFKAVKEHIANLGKNILKAIRQSIDTFLEFFLKMFGLEKKEGEEGGIDMLKNLLGRVVDNLVKTISDLFQTVIDGIMSFTQDMVRSLPGGDMIADATFGKRAVKDMSVEEQIEERKELKGQLEDGDQQKEVEGLSTERDKAEKKLKALEAEQEAKGGFDKLEKDQLDYKGVDQEQIIEAREALQAAKAKEKEAADKLKADQERLKKLNESLDPNKKQLEKPPSSETEKAAEVNKAANDNKASNIVVQQNDQSSTAQTEQKTVIEQNKPLSPDVRTSKLLDVGVF